MTAAVGHKPSDIERRDDDDEKTSTQLANPFSTHLAVVLWDKDNSMKMRASECMKYLSSTIGDRFDLYGNHYLGPQERVTVIKSLPEDLELRYVPAFFGLKLKGGSDCVEFVTIDPKLTGIGKGMHWISGVVEVVEGLNQGIACRSSLDVPILIKLTHVTMYNFAFAFNINMLSGFFEVTHSLSQSGYYYFDVYKM